MSSLLGASGDDAVTDALLESGERAAGATEWEEALISHRIIPAPPPPRPTADDDLLSRAGAKQRKGDGDDDDEDDGEEEEEEEEEEDDAALRAYRSRTGRLQPQPAPLSAASASDLRCRLPPCCQSAASV